MGLFENQVSLEDRERLRAYFDSYDYLGSGASFTSLYMWRNINLFSWQIIGDYLCIEGLSHLELETNEEVHFMMPPMTADGTYDPEKLAETIAQARKIFENAGINFTIRLVPEHMLEMIDEASPGMTFREDRPNYDYVYKVEKFFDYPGRKLHSKKNHLNYFKKTYTYECKPLEPDMTDEIMEFIRAFNRHKELPEDEMRMLLLEEAAMRDVFLNMERLDMRGIGIFIDGKLEGLALGGWLGKDTIVEHIEKANTEYRGLYQMVLSEFCRHVADRAVYINREEDMDLENLRTMKLSYHPDILLKKYIGEMKI